MNSSTALARVLAAALPQAGVRQVVLSPGSRSAPLAYALAAVEAAGLLRVHVLLDERAAGFRALGLARATGAPVAVVTTSGTAVANLHPAVLEAAYSGVPLLVLSADRPHELRGTGANQTADQVRMFGVAARFFAEIPAPSWPGRSAAGTAAGWRNVLARALAAATGAATGDPGPVQLDLAFDDPLTPDDAEPVSAWPPELTGASGLTRVYPRAAGARAASGAGAVLGPGPRTVVLAGDGSPSSGQQAAQVAATACWPLLAEPSSQARSGSVPAYRLLLGQPELGGAIERVVVFGRATLSRPVTRLLARDDVEVIVVSPRPGWADPARRAAAVLPALGAQDVLGAQGPRDWLVRWQAAGQAAAHAADTVLDTLALSGQLTGPLVAREVDAATGPDDVLVAGSSNPIRDLDLVGARRADPGLVLANRGLAGIDGVVSTAAGVALAGTYRRVRALLGDLTLLHDAGGLAVGSHERVPDLQLVVADDSGGSIFETLEQGDLAGAGPAARALFERYFATPQRVDLAALCAAYGVRHTLVTDLPGLRSGLADPPAGLSLLQVPVRRSSRRELAQDLAAAVQRAVSP